MKKNEGDGLFPMQLAVGPVKEGLIDSGGVKLYIKDQFEYGVDLPLLASGWADIHHTWSLFQYSIRV